MGSSRPATIKAALALIVALTALIATVVGSSMEFVTHHGSRSSIRPLSAAAAARGSSAHPLVPDTLLAWTSGGLPHGFASRVSRIDGVDRMVGVVSGIAWLTASYSATGERVDRPPAGLAFPIEVAGADPVALRSFLSGASRALLPAVAAGGAILGQTSAALRHLGVGGSLVFGNARLRVVGIMPDGDIGANEVFVSRDVAADLGLRTERYLLIDPAAGASRPRIAADIRAAAPSGEHVTIRGSGETPYLRQGDAVLPQVILKERLGEFAARPEGGDLVMDPRWVQAHLLTGEVPILGRVTCHRALFPQLRGAWRRSRPRAWPTSSIPPSTGGAIRRDS